MSISPQKISRTEDKNNEEVTNPTLEEVNDESAVSSRFEELFNCPLFSDIKLNIGDDQYYAHKFLLVTASEVFKWVSKLTFPPWTWKRKKGF